MQKNKKMGNQDEVRTLLLSLLIARKGATPIPVLERDYYDMENKRIPYRKFGCTSLVQFLQSMPEHFVVEEFNGGHYVSGIADKSKHVSSLVSRQKTSSNLRPRYSFRQAPTFHRRIQHTRFQPVRMTTEKLIELVQYIKSYPNGVSLENAVLYAQTLMPYVSISQHDLQAQLYEVMHQLRLDGNMIHAIQNDSQSNVAQQPSNQQPLMKKPLMQLWNKSELPRDSLSPPTQQTEYAAGEEDFELADFSDDAFVPVRNNTDNYQRRPKTSEMLATNLAQHVKSEQTDMFNYSKNPNDIEILENNYFMTNSNYTETRVTECLQDKSEIVSDRIKARLEKLLQKYPDGIWCADLPDIYLREYKVHLNYNKLGFTSVREFTSYLPKIFYMTQVNKTDDFKLYNADKRPVVPKADPINETSHNHCYDEHRTAQAQYNNDSDDEPIPSDVSPTITKKFAPDGVMNYGDDIGKILVTDLKRTKKFLEIYVMEVFHPNFFWIHLRENRKRFNKMMDELHTFYVRNKDKYTIARVALKKDLNCACVYADKWHRAIIKSVKPDFRVTVCFYDYGTVKTYAAENIYYLHSMFSILPAQAIPCSLYNIKPTVGDRWKKSANDQFVDKINETLLAATIITIDPPNNSMLVVLTDTSEDEDVCINDWLVKEKLAQVGKTVRINDIKNYLMLDFDSAPSIRIDDSRREDNVNKSRHCRDQSILHDERTHVLSDVKSEDIEKKTVKSSHNIHCKKKALQLLNKSPDAKFLHVKSPSIKSTPTKSLDAKSPNTSLDANSSDTKSLDAELQSSNSSYSQNGRSKTPKELELTSVLKKLEKSKLNGISGSNLNTFISKTNTDNENNVRQIDSSKKKESRCSSDNWYGFMDFSLRNSDDEDDQNDFGTFKSLYGGHGSMEPIDWSVIREENNLAHRTVTPMRECKSDVEDKSGSHNQKNELQRNKLPGKQYFLDLTSLEKENFLPEDNIDYNVENESDFLDILKDNTVSNHTVTVMFTPNVKLKTLLNNRSEDTNSGINVVELNDVTSSKDQKVDRNGKVCNGKVRADEKIRDRDSNIDSQSNTSNNKDNINREMSECSSDNSIQSNTNNKAYPFKTLLEKMKQIDSMNSSFINTSKSSSSEQIPLSSYSCNTSDDIISSYNEQIKASNVMDSDTATIIKKPVSEKLSKKLTVESHSDSEGTRDLSSLETDSIASSNVDDTKQCWLNQSMENDSAASSNADNTKQHQLNQSSDFVTPSCNINGSNHQLTTIDQTLNGSKLMQQMLKITQNIENNSELDSDDLSQESLKDDKNDESKGDDISDCMSETYESMNDGANMIKKPFIVSDNDCDVASFDDSEWDAGVDSDFLFQFAEMLKQVM